MRGPKPHETISQFAIRTAWEYGHFWGPDNPEGHGIKQSDLKNLSPADPVVVQAMISLSKMDATRYTRHVLEKHTRLPDFDGAIGPAMISMMKDEGDSGRCPVPDFAPPKGVDFSFDDPDLQQVVLRMQNDPLPAIGEGNWPSCHGINGFHCATVGLNTSGLPSFLSPVWKQVLTNVRAAYAGVGLLWKFIENGKDVLTGESFSGVINTELSFVTSSQGWIGLAIVGTNEGCSSKIWCKFLATYKGGSNDAAILQQWTTLIKHELGHNCGRGHTSGGVMNPSIVNGLPTEWNSSDPSTSWLKQQFGGIAVPIPGSGPGPGPGDPIPSTLEQRVLALEVRATVDEVVRNWCVNEIRKLKGEVP